MEETKTLISRCKSFFGLKVGQTLSGFQQEVKELTDKDREDLVRWFNDAGMPTVNYASELPKS